jgi:hypothetical protein
LIEGDCGRSYASADGWQVGALDFPLVESVSRRVADSWIIPVSPGSSKDYLAGSFLSIFL